MAQPRSSNQPTTFQHQPSLNTYGHIDNANIIMSGQNDGHASNLDLRNRSVLRPKRAEDSDAASSGGLSVTDSLRWGVRRKRNSAERDEAIDRAVADLKTARRLLDTKRLTAAGKQKTQDLTYAAERAIADLRKENADLRKANADLRKKVAKRYNKA